MRLKSKMPNVSNHRSMKDDIRVVSALKYIPEHADEAVNA
jgi:hypothetical protein